MPVNDIDQTVGFSCVRGGNVEVRIAITYHTQRRRYCIARAVVGDQMEPKIFRHHLLSFSTHLPYLLDL